ncbi:MAG: DUF4974 domain-containing protein [Chitinophagaceae bacterium]|nr:MAG: DUF4974 domain-containing protein [Chitinophagaceae bacterium]
MKKIKKDFGDCSLADLLENPDFVAWATAPDANLDSYWQSVMAKHPKLTPAIEQGKKLMFSMQFDKVLMDSGEHASLWAEIARRTVLKEQNKMVLPVWSRTLAAAMLVFAFFCASFYFYANRYITISTGFGQTKEAVLPDGSIVLLNANSSVRYANNMHENGARELWLDGEALFDIKHLHRFGRVKKQQLFIVHAGKAEIEVLGTTFNVRNRREKVELALLKGKVAISVSGSDSPSLIVAPGQQTLYDLRRDTLVREDGNIKATTAWKDGMLVFDDLSAEELFGQLEDSFGYRPMFEKPSLKKKRISGTFASGNYDHLLKAIGLSLGISIIKQENPRQLIIR